ncbi:MAG: 30S ribosomal protein S1 [Candidatus Dadabacteria bacterium]|nr:30S ribosomal protein S1 [Candidatus Dadabacteria bacterium]NIQ15240.1 30S ribosomal protein S1 [Candidatus Dadabacteria bacterium]
MNQESNFASSVSNETSEKSFEELLDESLNVKSDDEGKSRIVKGTVIRIESDDIFIDLGYKSEGIISKSEFLDKDGQLNIDIGSEVEVLLETTGSNIPKVSKQKADIFKEKQIIDEKYKNNEPLQAKVINKVKGGLSCNIGNISTYKAFLPGSQIDIRPVSNFDQFVGQTLDVKIINYDNKGIVISRRILLQEQREILKKETLSSLKEDQIIKGKIVKIIDRGLFVDIGGIEGFVPISEISWGTIKHPGDVVKLDDEIDVKILKIDNERITLGIKQTTDDPWDRAQEKYPVGTNIKGKIVSTTDFGAFVELEPGIEGLIHISELSWTKNFRHPKEVVDISSDVEVVVLDIQPEKRKISLSLKQIEKSPWEQFKDDNPIGTKLKGIIKNITELGLFVEVAPDLVGLVRPENISWNEKVNPLDVYESSKVGEEIDVVVLNVIPKNKRIGLGIKQISEDPWKNVLNSYKANESVLTSKIVEINKAGLFIEVENNIMGIYRPRELSASGGEDILKAYNVGDEITGIVTGFDKNKRQVYLSQSKLEQKQEKDRLDDFVASQGESSFKLGELLDEKLKSLD